MNYKIALFIFVIAVDYVGISEHLPIINTVKLPLLASLFLFCSLVAKGGINDLIRHKVTKLFIVQIAMTALSFFAYNCQKQGPVYP